MTALNFDSLARLCDEIRLLDAGPIEVVNPTYAQSYFFQSSGESAIRQFDYGIRKMREHFPNVVYTTYAAEEPCFTSCLPPVLKSFGYEFAVLKNPNTCWGGYTAAYGGELVNWIGPDGTPILAVPRYACEGLQDGSCWQTTAFANSPDYIEACFAQGIGLAAERIELVELDGRVIEKLEPGVDGAGRGAIRLSMPRFGIRTLRFDGIRPPRPE